MILNQTFVYALRALAALAQEPAAASLRAADLATRTDVGVHYLSKVMRRLVDGGLVSGRKGPGGGFTLARPLDRIRIADVLAALDLRVESEACSFGRGDCDPERPCPLHAIWSRLQVSVDAWSRETTLADTIGVDHTAWSEAWQRASEELQ